MLHPTMLGDVGPTCCWSQQSIVVTCKTKSQLFISVFVLLDSGVKIFGRSENVLKCLNVNTISLNSQMCNHARLRAV